MTEREITNWMRQKVEKDGFKTAAELARQFLDEHNIRHTYHPEFSKALYASFEIAEEMCGPFSKCPEEALEFLASRKSDK